MCRADYIRFMMMLEESDFVTKKETENGTEYNYDWIGENVGVTIKMEKA